MAERMGWVAKAEAARELEVSISTLDRMIRRPPRSTLSSSSAASDVYKRQTVYAATADRQALEEMEAEYEKERAARRRTRRLAVRLGLVVVVLLAVVGLLTWRLFA